MARGSVEAHGASGLGDVFVQLRLSGGARIGPGKAELLEHIAASGSISEAARRMSMSYRRAWALVREMNSVFDEDVVTTKVGGAPDTGARLTGFGSALLERYRAFQQHTRGEADELLAWLNARITPENPDG